MPEIEEPKYFIYALLILGLVVLYLLQSLWKKQKQKQFSSEKVLNRLSPERSVFKPILKLVLLSICVFFLVISLVNPKIGTALKTVKRQGVDIVFALDISKSMLAEDMAPSRLDKAKQIILRTIAELENDRVGIIVYAGDAFPLLPITTDHASANMFLENASPDMVSSQGTALSDAIAMGIDFYDNEEETNKYMIIVSDGEDHEESSMDLVAQASKEGIKIFTIGVGTLNGGKIPEYIAGNKVGYKKDRNGNVVVTKLNQTILKEVATQGNGAYFYGKNTKETVTAMDTILDKAEKSLFETKQYAEYKDQFQWFVGFGLLFLVFDIFVFDKKTGWIQKLNLFNQADRK